MNATCFSALFLFLLCLVPARALTLSENGEARLPVLYGSAPKPAEELATYLRRISEATFECREARKGDVGGIYVGLVSDFPWLNRPPPKRLGPETFWLTTDHESLYLLADRSEALEHGVFHLLHQLGCRWFFPGEVWEVIPKLNRVEVHGDLIESPDFPGQRNIWYGYGAYPRSQEEWGEWCRRNQMGGAMKVRVHHSWLGLKPDEEFESHPEWFALVEGKRQPTKPCYSHPEVIERAKRYALSMAESGEAMVNLSPPDGLGFCECERCQSVFQGATPVRKHRTLFAERPDGVVVNITSENLFQMVNQVAEAVSETFPDTLIGCYAYSDHSHPPSFALHDQVYVQVTTSYRRTDLSPTEQLRAFGRKTRQLGVREYYSIYQWTWDEPYPGRVSLHRLQQDLRFFHANGITGVNAEASNNWGACGLGYYAAARLMWDLETDMDDLLEDFLAKAFGPAAEPMRSYYRRWYEAEGDPRQADVASLKEAFADLDRALEFAGEDLAIRARIDQLRMYLHYLVLRRKVEVSETKEEALASIKAETRFAGRLTHTGMIHARPILGKAFPLRFKQYRKLLKECEEANSHGVGWRVIGEPPEPEELNELWSASRRWLVERTAPNAITFVDAAEEVGLSSELKGMMGHAAAWGDVDGDGWLDLFVGTFADRKPEQYREGGATGPIPNLLFFNRNGQFVPSGQEALAWKGRASGSVMADLNNDGFPELYVANNGRLGKENLLYRNDGQGNLERVAADHLQLPEFARSVTVLDYDGDGLLDLLVLAGIRKGPSRLFKNLGDLKFESVDELPADLTGLGVAAGDLTGNGWPDLVVGGSNRLFLNQAGRFREAEFPIWGEAFEAEDRADSCGVALGDVDRDGDLDVLMGAHTKTPWRTPVRLRLLLNDGKGRFSDISEEIGLPGVPMRNPHVEIRDFNNDGWPDLYTSIVVFKDGRTFPVILEHLGVDANGRPNFRERAFVHRPDFPQADDLPDAPRSPIFYDRLVANRRVMYFAPGPSADFDRDGKLDLFLPSWFPKSPSLLLRNTSDAGHFLRVRVEGGAGVNHSGIGAMVRAYAPGSDQLIASELISTGYGYASGQPPVAHLGLGQFEQCDLVITLPHGRGTLRRKVEQADREITVEMAE